MALITSWKTPRGQLRTSLHGFAWKWVAGITLCLGLAVPGVAAAAKAAPSEELGKVASRWQEAVKTTPVPMRTCESIAKDFEHVGSSGRLAEGYFNAGVVWDTCGSADKAQAFYRQALSVNAKFAPALVNLGLLALRAGDQAMAQKQLDAALEADSKNVQAYNGAALVLFERARSQNNDPSLMKQAIAQLRRALALDAESLPAYSLLSLVYYTVAQSDRSKLDLAELVCNQAKERNDKYPPIYNTLGLIKLKKRDVTGALREFRTAVELDPKYVEAQLNIGAITLSSRDYKSAEQSFRAVLDTKPTNQSQLFDATIGLGVALRGQRRIDEAEQWYGKAKGLNAKECSIPYNLGILYQDYKSSSEAELTRARGYFTEFLACKNSRPAFVQDAQRRIKDIDDTFKALAENKKLEEENRKLQEEAERMMQQQKEREQKNAQGAPKDGTSAPGPQK